MRGWGEDFRASAKRPRRRCTSRAGSACDCAPRCGDSGDTPPSSRRATSALGVRPRLAEQQPGQQRARPRDPRTRQGPLGGVVQCLTSTRSAFPYRLTGAAQPTRRTAVDRTRTHGGVGEGLAGDRRPWTADRTGALFTISSGAARGISWSFGSVGTRRAHEATHNLAPNSRRLWVTK